MSEVDLPRRLERYAGTATIKRVALTAADVMPGTDLPSFNADTKAMDTRYDWFVENYGDKCWELDALSPVVLRNRIEAEIIMLLDLDAWEHAISVEAAEVESMRDFHDRWKQSISGPAHKYSDGDA